MEYQSLNNLHYEHMLKIIHYLHRYSFNNDLKVNFNIFLSSLLSQKASSLNTIT